MLQVSHDTKPLEADTWQNDDHREVIHWTTKWKRPMMPYDNDESSECGPNGLV